jgi:opacity protein-like surface antigen
MGGVIVRRLLFLIVIFFAFVSCSFSYAQEIDLSGKLGGFIFTSDDVSFKDYWASEGFLIGGRISYHFNKQSILSLDIEDVKSEKNSSLFGYSFSTKAHVLSVMVLYERKLLKDTKIMPYIGSGFGITRLSGDISVGIVGQDLSESDFAYKYLIGLDIGRNLFLEVGYMSGGLNGNTGIYLLGGCREYISK